MDKYEKGAVLGHGTFGSVYKATNKEVRCAALLRLHVSSAAVGQGPTPHHYPQTNTPHPNNTPPPKHPNKHQQTNKTGAVVAIKKINVGAARAGVDVTSLREIKLLRELRSPYVVSLLDVFPHKRKLAMVRMRFCCMRLVMVVVGGV
jgi:serine/threonine protein kinase